MNCFFEPQITDLTSKHWTFCICIINNTIETKNMKRFNKCYDNALICPENEAKTGSALNDKQRWLISVMKNTHFFFN